MKITEDSNHIIVTELDDFSLSQTLECGQCFRYTKLENDHYLIVAKGKLLDIEQTANGLYFYHTTLTEFNEIWQDYFDLTTDYKKIKNYLIHKDVKMKDIIQTGAGIRILNQDFVETLISFIISQNKQIPQIKQVVETICVKYGTYLSEYNGKKYYTFPSIEKLSTITEEQFRECKAGFRAKYLVDACSKLADGSICESNLKTLSALDMRNKLCTIKGVGVKVSNCVLLYGLKQKDAFPIDVWIKRIMENLYFKEETKTDIIQAFAEEKFGHYGGYAQQYLFYYSRS